MISLESQLSIRHTCDWILLDSHSSAKLFDGFYYSSTYTLCELSVQRYVYTSDRMEGFRGTNTITKRVWCEEKERRDKVPSRIQSLQATDKTIHETTIQRSTKDMLMNAQGTGIKPREKTHTTES